MKAVKIATFSLLTAIVVYLLLPTSPNKTKLVSPNSNTSQNLFPLNRSQKSGDKLNEYSPALFINLYQLEFPLWVGHPQIFHQLKLRPRLYSIPDLGVSFYNVKNSLIGEIYTLPNLRVNTALTPDLKKVTNETFSIYQIWESLMSEKNVSNLQLQHYLTHFLPDEKILKVEIQSPLVILYLASKSEFKFPRKRLWFSSLQQYPRAFQIKQLEYWIDDTVQVMIDWENAFLRNINLRPVEMGENGQHYQNYESLSQQEKVSLLGVWKLFNVYFQDPLNQSLLQRILSHLERAPHQGENAVLLQKFYEQQFLASNPEGQ